MDVWKEFSEAFKKMKSTEANGETKHHWNKKIEHQGEKFF